MTKAKPSIAFIGDKTACGYYRIHLPALELRARGWDVFYEDLDAGDLANADILVMQRLNEQVAIETMLEYKRAGKKLVVDFDDNYFRIDALSPAKKGFSAAQLEWVKRQIEVADMITVTCSALADSCAGLNKNVVVLPNEVDGDKVAEMRAAGAKPSVDPIIVGWQGSQTHEKDLALIRNPLKNLYRRLDFDLVVAGYRPAGFPLTTTYRRGRMFESDLGHMDLFSDFSIGLAPIVDSHFNACKSDIKFLEYTMQGAATIASKFGPYLSIDHGVTGYLARNKSDWEKLIAELIQDQDKRERMAEQALKYVMSERTIQKNIGLWEEAYQSL